MLGKVAELNTHQVPPIHLSDDDWSSLTEKGTLCNQYGELDLPRFVIMLKEQVLRQ